MVRVIKHFKRGNQLSKRALILSGIPWNTTIQRHHNIARLLYKLDYEVVFVEKIPSSIFTVRKLIGRIRNKLQGKKSPVSVNMSGIRVINQRFLNPMKGLYWLINKYLVRRLVEKIGPDFDVVINYLPVNTTYNILENINAELIIYDCVRDFENWGGYPRDINFIEKKLVSNSDMVLTDSYYLTNKIKNKYNASSVLQILPTVDEKLLDILRNGKLKSRINNVLYFGAVGSHIDIHILNSLAEEGYLIHIIGEVEHGIPLNNRIINHGFISDMEILAQMIVETADALIIPYRGNMDGVIPAKLMQCIATGLPIFINEFYDSNILSKYLYIYDDYNHLKELIEQFNFNKHQKVAKEMINFSKGNSSEHQFGKLKSIFQ
jgi:hypothetical protein